MKMAALAMSEDNSDLASQCMVFCQALASKGQTFSFSLNVGPSFTFSLDTRGNGSTTLSKKRKTPSTQRRNSRRRAEFLAKKHGPPPETEPSVEKETEPEEENIFQCDQCENNFKSENGLKIHIGKTHKKVDSILATPERPRQHSRSSVSLSASPLLDTSREESSPISSISETPTNIFCKSCRSYKSPNHTCHQCGGCGKICNSRDDLGQHNNTIHPLMCYICFQFFKDKESKAKHWREIHLMNLEPTEANQGSLK